MKCLKLLTIPLLGIAMLSSNTYAVEENSIDKNDWYAELISDQQKDMETDSNESLDSFEDDQIDELEALISDLDEELSDLDEDFDDTTIVEKETNTVNNFSKESETKATFETVQKSTRNFTPKTVERKKSYDPERMIKRMKTISQKKSAQTERFQNFFAKAAFKK